MSIRTTSPSSFAAAQCAVVAPTFPAPTIVILAANLCHSFSDSKTPPHWRGHGDTQPLALQLLHIIEHFDLAPPHPGTIGSLCHGWGIRLHDRLVKDTRDDVLLA